MVILVALTLVSLPLWIALYRTVGRAGDGAPVADVMGLTMMLLGILVTGGAAWIVLVELRCRVRLVDAVSRRAAPPTPPPYVDYAAYPDYPAAPVRTGPHPMVPIPGGPEASGGPPGSVVGLLRSFGQAPAQVAMLAVALTLFIGAITLSQY
jgi:hypothetical protein